MQQPYDAWLLVQLWEFRSTPLYHLWPEISACHADLLSESQIRRNEFSKDVEHRLWLSFVARFVQPRVISVEVAHRCVRLVVIALLIELILLCLRHHSFGSLQLGHTSALMLLSLDLVQNAVEVFFIQNLILVLLENGQNQRVEEDPLVLEEFVEEEVHVLAGYDRGEEAEDPLARVHLGADVVFDEVALQLGKVALN